MAATARYRHLRPLKSSLSWGVEFTAGDEPPMLLGQGWLSPARGPRYIGEPPRMLLFKTKGQASAWCDEQREKCGKTKFSIGWEFKPVQVIETVVKLDKSK